MASNFDHTLRSLNRKGSPALWLCPALSLLFAWGVWMHEARLSTYASTPHARVEVSDMPSRVATEVGGRILELNVELGKQVESGDLLLRLDSSVQEAELNQQLTQLKVLAARREGLKEELTAVQTQRHSRSRLGARARERAVLGLGQAQVSVLHQQQLSTIAEELQRERLSSRIDTVNAEGDLLKRRFAVEDAETEVARLGAELDYQDKSELTRFVGLNRQLIEVDAERLSVEAAVATARVQLQRLRVTAPASGRVGQIVPLQQGDVVQAGQVLATLVPSSEVRIAAQFRPERAVGVVQPGQAARVRIDGFSWFEFGALEARVTHVASEPDNGWIRVELRLSGADSGFGAPSIPLQHGLTAAVDVQTDQLSPWALVQRSVGAGLGRPLRSNPADDSQRLARETAP